MVLSIDTEKRIGQKSTSICEKNQSEIREDFLNIINNIYQNSIAIIILNDKKKTNVLILKIALRSGYLFLSFLVNIVLEVSVTMIRHFIVFSIQILYVFC